MSQEFVSNYPFVYVFFLALAYFSSHLFYKITLGYKESRKKYIYTAYTFMVVLSTMIMFSFHQLPEDVHSTLSMVFSIGIVLFYDSSLQKKIILRTHFMGFLYLL